MEAITKMQASSRLISNVNCTPFLSPVLSYITVTIFDARVSRTPPDPHGLTPRYTTRHRASGGNSRWLRLRRLAGRRRLLGQREVDPVFKRKQKPKHANAADRSIESTRPRGSDDKRVMSLNADKSRLICAR